MLKFEFLGSTHVVFPGFLTCLEASLHEPWPYPRLWIWALRADPRLESGSSLTGGDLTAAGSGPLPVVNQ